MELFEFVGYLQVSYGENGEEASTYNIECSELA